MSREHVKDHFGVTKETDDSTVRMGNSLSSVTQDNVAKLCDTYWQETEKPCLDRTGQPHQRNHWSQRLNTLPPCRFCLAPWKPIHENGMERCSNQSCEVVFTLLTCETVTNPSSKVLDCPIFRACAMCHSLIMHVDGCKYVSCQQCQYKFCFICLEDTKVCKQDKELYWALSCKKPRAKRQTFVT